MCHSRANTFCCNLWMLLLLSSFSLLLGRSERCAWSVTGHRTSFLVLYSGLHCAIVPRAGMGALHSGLGFPWLSPPCHPVMRGSDLKATLEKVGPTRPVALMLQSSVPLQHFPFLFFFLLLIQLKFFLVSFRESLYCEVNNDLGVPTFRNMFNTLFKHWQIIWNKDRIAQSINYSW